VVRQALMALAAIGTERARKVIWQAKNCEFRGFAGSPKNYYAKALKIRV